MSWWPLPDSPDDVTGDAPADAVDGALLALVAARARAGLPKPTLAQIACALDAACRSAPGLFADAVQAEAKVVAVRDVDSATDAPADLRDAVAGALAGLAAAYWRAFERAPRLAEALYAFTFAFGGQPQTLASGPLPQRVRFERVL